MKRMTIVINTITTGIALSSEFDDDMITSFGGVKIA